MAAAVGILLRPCRQLRRQWLSAGGISGAAGVVARASGGTLATTERSLGSSHVIGLEPKVPTSPTERLEPKVAHACINSPAPERTVQHSVRPVANRCGHQGLVSLHTASPRTAQGATSSRARALHPRPHPPQSLKVLGVRIHQVDQLVVEDAACPQLSKLCIQYACIHCIHACVLRFSIRMPSSLGSCLHASSLGSRPRASSLGSAILLVAVAPAGGVHCTTLGSAILRLQMRMPIHMCINHPAVAPATALCPSQILPNPKPKEPKVHMAYPKSLRSLRCLRVTTQDKQ